VNIKTKRYQESIHIIIKAELETSLKSTKKSHAIASKEAIRIENTIKNIEKKKGDDVIDLLCNRRNLNL
jgi:hypothetical protein